MARPSKFRKDLPPPPAVPPPPVPAVKSPGRLGANKVEPGGSAGEDAPEDLSFLAAFIYQQVWIEITDILIERQGIKEKVTQNVLPTSVVQNESAHNAVFHSKASMPYRLRRRYRHKRQPSRVDFGETWHSRSPIQLQ